MGNALYIETIKKLIRNSKTHVFMVFLFIGIALYSILILPNNQPMDTVDLHSLDMDMQANKSIMEDRARAGKTEVNLFTGQSAYQNAKFNYERQRSFKSAIQSGDAKRVIQLGYIPEKLEKEIREFYLAHSEEPLKDLNFDQTNKHLRFTSYLEELPNVDFHIIQEKTAWQQIHLFFLNWGPLILGASAIFLVSDVVTRERQEKTQRAGIPYNWKKQLFVQSLAAFSFVLLISILGLVAFWAINGVMFGFGNLSMKIPLYTYSTDFVTNQDVFGLMTIGTFIKKIFPYFFILTYLLIRLSTLFSLWFKHDVVVMLGSFFVLFFEKLYFDRRMQGIFGIPLGFFPQTYFDYGKVVAGEKSYLLNTDSITVARGLLVLGVMILLIEGGLWVTATFQTRQKFIA